MAGIQPDPAAPAFAHVFIEPNVVGDLTWAKASYDSVRGRIASDWKVSGNLFRLAVTVPANGTATVSVPVANPAMVRENGVVATQVKGIRFVGVERGRSLLEIGSGTYHFSAPR